MLSSSVLAQLALLVVCLINSCIGSQILSVTQFQTSTCADRQSPGIFCSDCNTVAVCVKIGNSWETYWVESCSQTAGLYCNEFDGGCSDSLGSCNPTREGGFECNTPGVFPDPYNCRLYHMCFLNGNNPVAIHMDCGGAAFSPATGDCSLTLNDTVCLTPQFTCNVLGQMDAWPGNNNIYYICAAEMVNEVRVLRPRLYRCPANQMFQNGQCVQRDWSNMPPGTMVPHECQRPGLFVDPSHCRYYYSCNADLVPTHLLCPEGTYFNANTLSCVLGFC
uniref:Chitin-binding type-2 domain-containing protein n=1 Tax=Anopheles minimus TaxID=112268 RepID=A0A182WMK3_9DIPT